MAKKKKIGSEERAKIIKESYQPGCIITELAQKYKISSGVLYRWRAKYKQRNNNGFGGLSDEGNKFVEVTVSDAAIEQEDNCKGSKPVSVLQKVLLEYNNLTITVEGNQVQEYFLR
jgi:transposase-like protein